MTAILASNLFFLNNDIVIYLKDGAAFSYSRMSNLHVCMYNGCGLTNIYRCSYLILALTIDRELLLIPNNAGTYSDSKQGRKITDQVVDVIIHQGRLLILHNHEIGYFQVNFDQPYFKELSDVCPESPNFVRFVLRHNDHPDLLYIVDQDDQCHSYDDWHNDRTDAVSLTVIEEELATFEYHLDDTDDLQDYLEFYNGVLTLHTFHGTYELYDVVSFVCERRGIYKLGYLYIVAVTTDGKIYVSDKDRDGFICDSRYTNILEVSNDNQGYSENGWALLTIDRQVILFNEPDDNKLSSPTYTSITLDAPAKMLKSARSIQ